MKYSPHSYQQYAVKFITENPVSCLLLDMGLGKTVVTLTAISVLADAHKVLVIAPLRVARDVWPAEIAKWDHLYRLTYACNL